MTDQNEPLSPDSPPASPQFEQNKLPEAGLPKTPVLPPEIGGQKGPEPTRFGDWEKNGRCTDF
jgi:hypothetical protein